MAEAFRAKLNLFCIEYSYVNIYVEYSKSEVLEKLFCYKILNTEMDFCATSVIYPFYSNGIYVERHLGANEKT